MVSFLVVFFISFLLAKLFGYFVLRMEKPIFSKRYIIAILSVLYTILNYYIILVAILAVATIVPNNLTQVDATTLIRNVMLSSVICSVLFYRMVRK